jgi:RNase H-like domain found in reverse transcriptase/Reverse transcriptase (RNA-dependent DNA polymerase)
MDDALVTTEDNLADHERKVNHFLAKLAEHDLYLKPEKCKFYQKEVEYLGVVIGGGKVKMDPAKVEGIIAWPMPTTVKDIWSFLGFCNFYRAFIPSFSHTAQPLNDLTKKDKLWSWGTKEAEALQMLKNICISYPVLCTPDWSKQFIMETDASGYALGAVLMQEFEDGFYPIAFNSRSLLPAEQNYDAHDKELAGVIFGFKCSRPFLLGAKYVVHIQTDRKNLQYFRQPQKING